MQGTADCAFELIELDALFDANGWKSVRVAINGIPAAPFQFHRTVYDTFPTDAAWLDYLARQGQAMIDRGLIYGQERPQPPDENYREDYRQ